jgi:hypothetical protein
MHRILFSGLLFLGLPLLALAQHAGMAASSGMHAAPMSAPAGGFRAAPVAHYASVAGRPTGHMVSSHMRSGTVPHRSWHPVGTITSVRHVTSPANPVVPNGRWDSNSFPVPGLGFDYPHFFATHPNFARTHRTNGFILPFLGGGIYVPYPYYADIPSEQEQAASYEPNDAPDTSAESTDRASSAAPAQSYVRPSYTPPQPQDEYVFVRRDGTVFFAVAYSWGSDKLQYVTKDGLRRSVSLDALDLGATQQFNEQRGISIRLPA